MHTQYREILLAASVTAALLLPLGAQAQRGEGVYYAPPSFEDMDLDTNQMLDPSEVQGRSPLSGQWARFDVNRDGLIDREEFAAFQTFDPPPGASLPPAASPRLGPEIGAPGFNELDISGDGVLSKGEAGGRKGLLDEFWQVDQDGDGVIDRSEFSAFEELPGSTVQPGTELRP
jgi:hypothetical protein